VGDGLVEEFPIVTRHSGDSMGYRLTARGMGMFEGLMGAFQKDSGKMREILAEFAPEQSLDHVTTHIYAHYPEHADKSAIWNRVGRGQ